MKTESRVSTKDPLIQEQFRTLKQKWHIVFAIYFVLMFLLYTMPPKAVLPYFSFLNLTMTLAWFPILYLYIESFQAKFNLESFSETRDFLENMQNEVGSSLSTFKFWLTICLIAAVSFIGHRKGWFPKSQQTRAVAGQSSPESATRQ